MRTNGHGFTERAPCQKSNSPELEIRAAPSVPVSELQPAKCQEKVSVVRGGQPGRCPTHRKPRFSTRMAKSHSFAVTGPSCLVEFGDTHFHTILGSPGGGARHEDLNDSLPGLLYPASRPRAFGCLLLITLRT